MSACFQQVNVGTSKGKKKDFVAGKTCIIDPDSVKGTQIQPIIGT